MTVPDLTLIETEAALREFIDAEGVSLADFFDGDGALDHAHEIDWLGDLAIEASLDRAFAAVPNFKLVTPSAKKKLSGLMAHYAKKPHPFTSCVTDNTKRFGKERAERICAVLKDLIRGTTKWRKGGEKKMAEYDLSEHEPEALRDFLDWIEDVDARAFGIEEGRDYAEFETEDMEGVQLLASGGPYFGAGSPPEGDYYKDADLQRLADNNNLLATAGELSPYLKVGHNEEQKLLRESGLHDDEHPATGRWSNFRVAKGKLLADAKAVPKKLSGLIRAGAFPRRSIELKRVVSQKAKPGEKFDVITAVSWLGAKAPAVRTLDDIAALYADGERAFEGEQEDLRVYLGEAGMTVWPTMGGLQKLRERVESALREQFPRKAADGTAMEVDFYVNDIAPGRALIENYGKTPRYHVAAFTDDGTKIVLAPKEEWVAAEQRWVASYRSYADPAELLRRDRLYAWDPRKHPRYPRGHPLAGQFAPSVGASVELPGGAKGTVTKVTPQYVYVRANGRDTPYSHQTFNRFKAKNPKGKPKLGAIPEYQRVSSPEQAQALAGVNALEKARRKKATADPDPDEEHPRVKEHQRRARSKPALPAPPPSSRRVAPGDFDLTAELRVLRKARKKKRGKRGKSYAALTSLADSGALDAARAKAA